MSSEALLQDKNLAKKITPDIFVLFSLPLRTGASPQSFAERGCASCTCFLCPTAAAGGISARSVTRRATGRLSCLKSCTGQEGRAWRQRHVPANARALRLRTRKVPASANASVPDWCLGTVPSIQRACFFADGDERLVVGARGPRPPGLSAAGTPHGPPRRIWRNLCGHRTLMHFIGLRLNTNLFSISFLLFTSGVTTLALAQHITSWTFPGLRLRRRRGSQSHS